MLSCTQYWMLMSPTTLSALASLGVQSRITSRHSAAIVCGGMLHAESPARQKPRVRMCLRHNMLSHMTSCEDDLTKRHKAKSKALRSGVLGLLHVFAGNIHKAHSVIPYQARQDAQIVTHGSKECPTPDYISCYQMHGLARGSTGNSAHAHTQPRSAGTGGAF